MAKRITKNHYVASRPADSPTPVHVSRNSAAYSDEEESPYTSRYNNGGAASSVLSYGGYGAPGGYGTSGGDAGSDIYVTSGAYRSPSEISRGARSHRAPSHYSVASTNKTRNSRKAGMTVEAMAAPNPFCPSIKGMCCLMLLLNLAIILVTLGFVIVIQFFEPVYVWILGIVFLIFGFLTLLASLIYCVVIIRESRSPKDINPEDLYWTHHWQKNIGTTPEINYRTEEKYNDDRYSDRYSVGKLSSSAKYSERNGANGRLKDNDRY